MKVLIAGAGGAIGRQLVPKLIERGHEVCGMVRRPESAAGLREAGAGAVLADALDAEQVARAVAEAEPDVIVHQLTALSASIDLRHFDRAFQQTNRLRTQGTDHLLAAGQAVGVRRVVAQSFAGWPYARTGGPVKTEDDPLDADPPQSMRGTLEAIRHLEDAVTGATWTEGIALRYGGFYGPNTSMDAAGEHTELIRKRRFPVVGDGGGVWSFIHVADAADATVEAVERGRRGIYNVVDDEPAAVGEWLPAVARALGAPPPRRFPRWLGRLAAGEAGVVMMTEIRGASNAKARRELGWTPGHPTWREALGRAA